MVFVIIPSKTVCPILVSGWPGGVTAAWGLTGKLQICTKIGTFWVTYGLGGVCAHWRSCKLEVFVYRALGLGSGDGREGTSGLAAGDGMSWCPSCAALLMMAMMLSMEQMISDDNDDVY